MKYFIVIILLLFQQLSYSQIYKEWVKSFGGVGNENIVDIATDNVGNIIVTGFFNSTTDFDFSSNTYYLTPYGNNDIFIAKYTSDGEFLWAIKLGGNDDDKPKDIHVYNDQILITGYYSGTGYFNPQNLNQLLISNGNYEIFFAKYSSNGQLLWAKSIGGTGPDVGRSIYTDKVGNVFLLGDFNATVDFDPGDGVNQLSTVQIPGVIDIFLAKYDANGNFLWVKQFPGAHYNSAKSMYIDALDNIFITAIFFSTIDMDPGPGVLNLTATGSSCDVLVAKYTPNGQIIWAKSFGGNQNDFSNAVYVHNSELYIVGHFQGVVDFDPSSAINSLSSAGLHDIYVSKFDTSGNYFWTKKIGSVGSDLGLSSAIDTSGNIYFSGAFSATVDFDVGSGTQQFTSYGNYDSYLCKFSSGGYYIIADHLGSPGEDRAVAIDIYDNFLYVAGYFAGTLSFNISPFSYTSVGQQDCYLVKYRICYAQMYHQFAEINQYQSYYFNNQYLTNSGIYYDTLPDKYGCDSIIVLHLTVNEVPLPVELVSFNVRCTTTGALIAWTTASETNNDYFTVERSTDLMNWKVVSTLKPLLANSNEFQNYEVEDKQIPFNEMIYYRLKQTDLDGRIQYYDVYSILCTIENVSLNIVGINIGMNSMNVLIQTNGLSSVKLTLYDVYGKIISQKNVIPQKGINQISFNNLSLESGMFLLEVLQNAEKRIKKIILY